MTRRLGAVGAVAVAVSALGAAGVWAAPAHGQILPPVTTPPIDVGVPGLGEVHVPGVELGGSDAPSIPGVPDAPPLPGTSGGSSSSSGSTGGVGSPPPAGPTPPQPADPAAPQTGATAPPSSTPRDPASSQEGGRALDAASRRRATDPSLGSAIAGAVTEPSTLVGALTLALGFGVVVGAAPYLPRYRRRQRELLEQWARASDRERTVAAKLAQADQQKSEFLALVSHELRTPLTAVKGFVDTVLLHWERLPHDRRRELLTRASSNADELGRLVRQLMEFGRTESGPIEIAPDTLEVASAVDVALCGIAPVTADHRVHVDVPAELAVDADADAFNHVLVNLLTNAVKFSPAGSTVAVCARRDGNEVVVSVADEGAGIPRDEQERIFDRFYQSQNGNHARGTGIGLTIAQRFTAQHGGRIWVESEPDHGATFSFTMPVAAGDLVPAQ
jgi:signal transduction histidine kinase